MYFPDLEILIMFYLEIIVPNLLKIHHWLATLLLVFQLAILTDPDGLCDVLQLLEDFLPQSFNLLQIIFHGIAQVHQVVQIYRITLSPLKLNCEFIWNSCTREIKK